MLRLMPVLIASASVLFAATPMLANSPRQVLNSCTKYGGQYHEDQNFKICHVFDGSRLIYTVKLNKRTGKLTLIYAARSATENNGCRTIGYGPNGPIRQCQD